MLRLAREGRGRKQDLARRDAGLARRVAHTTDVDGHILGGPCHLMHIAGDFRCGASLVMHGTGNDGGDRAELLDGGDRAADGLDGVLGRGLYVSDLHADSSVARAVCIASCLTSVATTAKLRPASPARAAWIAAFKASKLLWPAISAIKMMTLSIRLALSARARTVLSVRRVLSTASTVTFEDWAT
jgi:hypothetical protein